ncbi:ribonuclease P protein component [Microbacterium protaetiae]|uniref:Ribonuclease P protein component n=1 Tax=Microbacterium protaetiae TaxID=2509458 RepID=A0A4P6ECD9_9MICO|nr:ribonuclease P protein component [Microbacterium protaetiae]QAY59704.1 ribonuclease P protein component [Microbacterium protaetiae]
MLARPNRLTRGADYKAVVRRGVKCAGPHTVMYVVSSGEDRAARFGFIVSKRVGTAVTRNTVRRRLKAVCAQALPQVRVGADVVIRALPSAAGADFHALQAEVDRCLARRAA